MPITFKKKELLEDLANVGYSAVLTGTCAALVFGLEYINQNFLNGAASNVDKHTPVFSIPFAVYAGRWLATLGTVVEGLSTAYYAVKVPFKAVTMQYLARTTQNISPPPPSAPAEPYSSTIQTPENTSGISPQ